MSETVTVKIEINGVVYPISCMSGEEDRLIKSSKEVNKSPTTKKIAGYIKD